jgi:hypothetical protein
MLCGVWILWLGTMGGTNFVFLRAVRVVHINKGEKEVDVEDDTCEV